MANCVTMALSTPMLLVLSLLRALKEEDQLHAGLIGVDQSPISEVYFAEAVRRCGSLFAADEHEQIAIFLFMAYMHVSIFSTPFHAIGLLRYVGGLLNSSRRQSVFAPQPTLDRQFANLCSASTAQLRTWTQLHFILESDLFSELDGESTTPILRLNQVLPATTTDGQLPFLSSPGYLGQDDLTDAEKQLAHHFWLRLCQNRLLAELYPVEKAYCHPNEIGQNVTVASRELEIWYRSLPLDMQFARHMTITPHMSHKRLVSPNEVLQRQLF